MLEGEQGDGKWQVKFENDEGLVSAKIAPGVGEVHIDITNNGTKGAYDWYHFALVWELGPGLAGRGDMKFYVDGNMAEAAFGRSERVDHFSWVEPSNLLHIAYVYSTPVEAQYSNLRIYDRPAPPIEITQCAPPRTPDAVSRTSHASGRRSFTRTSCTWIIPGTLVMRSSPSARRLS
jgi:hypothetical protein